MFSMLPFLPLTRAAMLSVLAAWVLSRVSTTWLFTTLMLYGTSLTRLSTTRVRPPASTAVTLRAMPTPISWLLLSRLSDTPGKSSATLAGSSIAKLSGSLTGPDMSSTTCTRSPGNVEKLIASSVTPAP